MPAETVRAAVFFEDEEQRKLAEEALGAGPADAEVFNGVVEGWGTPDELGKLSERGMVVEPLTEPTVPPAGGAPGAPAPKLLADFEQQAEPPAEAGEESVFHIDLHGPITQEQRLELDSFGVDIYMFEPPSRYRTFLTPDQLEKVKQLPYVDEVTPYGFEESVTPQLLDAVGEGRAGGGPSLMGDEGASELPRFDALLHRSSDIEKVCALIEESEQAKVLDRSNLRVRFEAPLDAPFLAGLASLPEIRKLAPFRPPRLL
jgi:hypothetical protein